jgi:hypothetical protein
LVSDVEKERSRTDSSVEASVRVAEERIPANCGVADAAREVVKGVGPFRRVEPGIASVRRRNDCLRRGEKHKADKCERDNGE